MQLAQRTEGPVLVAKPCVPRVDARVAADFKQQLFEAVDAGHPLVALDLSEVDFIDSSGLGVIVSALKHVGEHGSLVIVGARPAVVNLLRLTRMDRVLRLYPGEADAIAALVH